MIQKYDYLYLNQLTTKPKNYIDFYQNKVPYFKIVQKMKYSEPDSTADPETVMQSLYNQGLLDEFPPSEDAMAAAKGQLTVDKEIEIEMQNLPMQFLPHFGKTYASSGGSLSPSTFFNKCENGEVGMSVAYKNIGTEGSPDYQYFIMRDDGYTYYYKNRRYLNIGNISKIANLSSSIMESDFQHHIMRLHILASAEGRKVGDGDTVDIPNFDSDFYGDLPDPDNDNDWEIDDEYGEISKESYTELLSNYSTMNGYFSGYYGTSAPILRYYIDSADSRFTENKSSSPYYFQFDLFSDIEYLLARYNISAKLYILDGSGGYMENNGYDFIKFWNGGSLDYQYLQFQFSATSSMGTFHHLELYF